MRTIAHILDAVIQLRDNFSSTLQTVEKSVGQFSRTAKSMGKDVQRVGRDLESVGSKMTTAFTVPLVAGIAASINEFAKLEQSLGGVETMFKDSTKQVIKNSETAYKRAGVSANSYMENITSFSARLLQGLGGDTEQAAKIADMAMVDMSDNANKLGTDISAIQNAYQGFAKANFTMLDNLKLGYGGTAGEMARLINETGVMGDAFEATAENVKDIPFDKMIEAINKVQTEMGVTGTTAKEAMETVSGSIGMAKASLQDFLGGLGNSDADVGQLTKNMVESFKIVVKNIKGVLATMWDNIPLAGWQKKLIAFVAAAGPMLLLVGKLTLGVSKGIFMFADFSKKVKLLGLSMKAIVGPGAIVAGVIAALIIGGILLYKNWDKIKAKVNEVFPNMKEQIATTMEHVRNIFNATVKFLSIVFVPVQQAFFTAWEIIKNIFWVGLEFIGSMVASIAQVLSGIIDFITGIFTGDWELAWQGIVGIFDGIFGGIEAVGKATINGIIGLINGFIGGANKIKLPDWIPGIGGKGVTIPLIPKLAKGTDFWKGGIVQVHERGGEVIDLPRGSRVYPHDESVDMARKQGRSEGNRSITIAKIADTVIIREEADIDKLANAFVRKIEQAGLNMA